MNALLVFIVGMCVGIVASIVAVVTALFLAYGRQPSHPKDAELDELLRRVAASQTHGWYDEMCRDCGGVGAHVIGCPQMEQAR